MKVKGKRQLCVCNDYKKYFKSIQGRSGFTLFDRYEDLENIVNKNVDEKYRHFLAQPELEGNDIYWFSQPYTENPRRLSELEGQERENYEKVKSETLSHYRSVVGRLRSQNKTSEAEALGNAIKFVNDDFVYCYDGKTVLGVWGMALRDEVREPLGIAMKNSFEKPKKPKEETEEEVGETDEEVVTASEEEEKKEESAAAVSSEPENPLKVKFFGGEHGTLQGQTEYDKKYGELVYSGEIPEVEPAKGYRFAGWDKNPVNYEVREDTEFTALYEEIEPEEKDRRKRGFWGAGFLNWLLALLLLALIGLLLWYLLGRHDFNFCGCECTEVVIVQDDPVTPPVPPVVDDPNNVPKPTKNCGVHFSGWYLSDKNEYPWRDCSKIFEEEEFGEYVGQGYYPDNTKILPKSMKHSFDAVAVSKGTHLIIYSEPNFKGREVLNVKGPILIENVIAKDDYGKLMTYTFSGELQELFPPERRQWSSENMHDWAKGSCKIICEQCE